MSLCLFGKVFGSIRVKCWSVIKWSYLQEKFVRPLSLEKLYDSGALAFRWNAALFLPTPNANRAKRIVEPPSIESIAQATAAQFGVPPQRLNQVVKGRGRANLARSAAITLSRRLGGHSLLEIAEAFGHGHYASVSVAVRRFKEQRAEDLQLDRAVKEIEKRLKNHLIFPAYALGSSKINLKGHLLSWVLLTSTQKSEGRIQKKGSITCFYTGLRRFFAI